MYENELTYLTKKLNNCNSKLIIYGFNDLGSYIYQTFKNRVIDIVDKAKKNEPIDVYIDHPSLFITAYRMHCNELEYSNEELANAFHLPQDVIERFCVPAKKYSLRIF